MCKWQCDNLDLCLAYTTSTFLVLSCEVTYGGVCGMLGNLTTNKMLSSRPIVFTCSKIELNTGDLITFIYPLTIYSFKNMDVTCLQLTRSWKLSLYVQTYYKFQHHMKIWLNWRCLAFWWHARNWNWSYHMWLACISLEADETASLCKH